MNISPICWFLLNFNDLFVNKLNISYFEKINIIYVMTIVFVFCLFKCKKAATVRGNKQQFPLKPFTSRGAIIFIGTVHWAKYLGRRLFVLMKDFDV